MYLWREASPLICKYMKITKVLFIIVLISFMSPLYPFPAEDIEIINNRDYFKRVHELFCDAKKSIYVIMFSAWYYDAYPDSPSNLLLRDLADAKKRGLDVKIILEQEEPAGVGLFKKKKIQPEQHERVVKFLKQNSIPYVLDSPDITTHSKLIIVDEIYTVIGSANWSFSALSKNNETSVVIKSQEVAKSYLLYFNKLCNISPLPVGERGG